jgi:hypothetical protein
MKGATSAAAAATNEKDRVKTYILTRSHENNNQEEL